MTVVEARRALSVEERFAIDDLYIAYTEAVNDGRLEDWPAFFTEDCLYQVIARENVERNLPLALIRAESRAMLEDRVVAIRKAMMFSPHYWHHVVSGVHPRPADDGTIAVRANYSIARTFPDRLSEVFQVGRYQDRVVRQGDQLLFKEKICIYDSLLVPNSLVFPV